MVLAAGSETTAHTLTIIHFFVLYDPEIRKKLTAELEDAMPNKFAMPELSVVEQLPYLVRPWLKLSRKCANASSSERCYQ